MNATNIKHKVTVPTDNPYIQSLLKIFNQFVLEECIGQSFAEQRMNKKISMAQELFAAERSMMRNTNGLHFGRFDESNTELIIKPW